MSHLQLQHRVNVVCLYVGVKIINDSLCNTTVSCNSKHSDLGRLLLKIHYSYHLCLAVHHAKYWFCLKTARGYICRDGFGQMRTASS